MAIKPRIAQKEVTLHIVKTFGIHMSKKLGQNFLIDGNVVDGIVAAAQVKAGDTVLEVGPGIGTLTQGLAEAGAEVTAVELDRRLLDVLAKTLEGYDNVKVIHGDILKIDISREINKEKYKLVANLPYYITTPIIMKFLEERLPVELLVTMVQKEVAQRMVAKPGGKDYGALSVAVQYYTEPEIMFIVPPKAFIPAPAVESAVIRCTVRTVPPVQVASEKMFFRVVKAAFAQRRKTLANGLKANGLDKAAVEKVLAQAGIDGTRRGEQLSLDEFAAIANAWTGLLEAQAI
ncbi:MULTISPECIES: 16S rRNA (adenine(1518)-N(6)/adenine(1519)-N(6))-dimethyltransferase RsmA [Sporomusa]|jgi:16S rRNA (adenine1518-N6/adenine1519-N6)-dimethyltransferase|uniref:Ribosomal RNA small subunit methyltransferase A n=1 Tax=Sporomusa sphaeroides DSM 2875 TaxID=1337886 RepID=A0ABP2C380_9FIRM|nr:MULTISPECIES: 16S rRNA (adenine(1518)-N(6)/adenine(1519)-N(6))-dimethyltransferase RsmA [Sporomusa]MCM0761334.1 16S rRNA (adenine(1518)-N(6)/adenine(1519)-N(6))-dimethyltransferase RsmA [Sporomusa sphaeroides DSM 2875]OLS56658.1 ribosomal RNA small subunit methyltransferase A [Sporomusa sphaeroides DSM 2875]CVK18974.1 Ribosomal RNA small subunit methyltransferase A [Sporomusa sphaeroides DSM 2875]HML32652.1 16S rRNA (adenine(1518)-N(6)/adenine(1519)-N(6))-dimethyltransferase RsmA [Sporomusa 